MCKRCSPYQIPPFPLSPSYTLAPLSIWGSLWSNSIGKSTKIFTPHTRAPQLILHAAQRSVQLPHPPPPSAPSRTVPAELSDVHVSAFYWACTTTTMWGAYVQPAGGKNALHSHWLPDGVLFMLLVSSSSQCGEVRFGLLQLFFMWTRICRPQSAY